MIETFTALLLAHLVADFLLQTRAMAGRKREAGMLLLHAGVVFVTAVLSLGSWGGPALAALAGLTLAHALIDALTARAPLAPLARLVADQALHLATIAALALLRPELWAGGLWAGLAGGQDWLLPAMATAAGFLAATRMGGFVVGALLAPYAEDGPPPGLVNGGLLIGLLERTMIFILVLAGEPAGIGFLIAAKSVLRFEVTLSDKAGSGKNHKIAEYVIIGTLASFGWAMAASFATQALVIALTP